ncbi:MAG: thioredoxin-dependent thiol peroxidase [Bacteroidota bacterium]|nr:thioredoxin-dependent thiol peroxidase [Bacteroidota bacterium]
MATLEVNQKAPAFEAKNQDGKSVNLAQFNGKKLVLYFYPKDDTPGCTKEACNLRDNYEVLKNKGYEILGVSPDDESKHQKFISKYDLPFDLLADPDHKVSEAYGVWVEKNMYGKTYMGIKRTTFVIDERGMIEEIIKNVKTDNHANQILA